jgi:hypothetical protein
MFAALAVKGIPNSARVLEGPVPAFKKYGLPQGGSSAPFTNWGLARFKSANFRSRFPFAEIRLKGPDLPIAVSLTGWSPFIPTDADNSSLPVAAIEYTFKNTSGRPLEYVFSYNVRNFMDLYNGRGPNTSRIKSIHNGFILSQDGSPSSPERKGDFAIFLDESSGSSVVDHCWFRGIWYDPLTMAWNHIEQCDPKPVPPVDEAAPGASLFFPLP